MRVAFATLALVAGCASSPPQGSVPIPTAVPSAQLVTALVLTNGCQSIGRQSALLAENAMTALVEGCASVPGGSMQFHATLQPGGRIEISAAPGQAGGGTHLHPEARPRAPGTADEALSAGRQDRADECADERSLVRPHLARRMAGANDPTVQASDAVANAIRTARRAGRTRSVARVETGWDRRPSPSRPRAAGTTGCRSRARRTARRPNPGCRSRRRAVMPTAPLRSMTNFTVTASLAGSGCCGDCSRNRDGSGRSSGARCAG